MMSVLGNSNSHSDEINSIILKKPKRIIRYGTFWILLVLVLIISIFACITPITLLYGINIESKSDKILTFKIESGQAKEIISDKYQFLLVEDANSSNIYGTQIKCEILSIKNSQHLLVIQAHVKNRDESGNKIVYDNFKFLRVEGVPFSKLVLSKMPKIDVLLH